MSINSGIELERKLLRVENVVGENVKQAEIRDEIEFPVKVKKIWETDANIEDVSTELTDDKVIVEGTIHKQIFFVAGETKKVDGIQYEAGEVFEKTVKEKFTEFVEVPGTNEDLDAHVETRIEFVDHEEIKDRKKENNRGDERHDYGPAGDAWRQIVVVEIFVKVFETVQLEVVTDVIAPDMDLDVVTELLKVDSVIGENTKQTEIVRDIDFPHGRRAKKIKEVITEVRNVSEEIIDDKVIVEGTLHKQILFVEAETNQVFETSVDEPFTVSVDVPGAREDNNVHVDVDVEYVDVDLKDGNKESGFSKARQTAVLEVFVKVTEDLQLEVVVDVIGEGIDVISEQLKVQGVIGENHRQVNIENDVIIDRPVKKIIETITDTKINHMETTIIDDKVIVEGEIEKQIFYVDLCNEAVFEKTVEEDFTTFVEIPGARENNEQNLQVEAEVEFVNHEVPDLPDWICGAFKDGQFDPEDYPIEQTAVLNVFAKVTETQQMDVVVDVVKTESSEPDEEDEDECDEANIKIVIVQRGDTLFKLAQKYNTTVEAIEELNPDIDPYNLQIGQQVRIPCHVDGAKG